MRVRCIAERPSPEQRVILGAGFQHERLVFGVTLGMEYLVFGIRILKGLAFVDIAQELEQLYPVPLFLFEITDPSVPSLWQIRQQDDGSLFLWPPSFFERAYYHEDLLEQVPSVVEDFRRVRHRLEAESLLNRAL